MVQFLDAVNYFPMLLNNINSNKVEPNSSFRECLCIKDTLCNTPYSL